MLKTMERSSWLHSPYTDRQKGPSRSHERAKTERQNEMGKYEKERI